MSKGNVLIEICIGLFLSMIIAFLINQIMEISLQPNDTNHFWNQLKQDCDAICVLNQATP